MCAMHFFKDGSLRKQVAWEAARLMTEHGIVDFQLAKRKAATRLGLTDSRSLPRNIEIEDALLEYQRIFKPALHNEWLEQLRTLAMEVMRRFEEFHPRLVGPVLSGVINEHSRISLHVFNDITENIIHTLHQNRISFSEKSVQVKFRDRTESVPRFAFYYAEVPVCLTVFAEYGLREAPLSPVNSRPMQRASIHKVEQLIFGG